MNETPRRDLKIRKVPEKLASLLNIAPTDLKTEAALSRGRADMVFNDGKRTFVCEAKASASSASVLSGVTQLKEYLGEIGRKAVPLLVVPYMGSAGQRICEAHGVSWFDLSGNADITAPGLRVKIDGRPNAYKERGRPSSVFAPRSARIARWLLVQPESRFTEKQLTLRAFANEVQVDPGLTSRALNRLEESGYIARERSTGLIKVLDRDRLLDDWRDAYDFHKHTIVEGHIVARSGEELLRYLGDMLERAGVEHAATGLGAGWLYTRFATFRLVTYYVADMPEDGVLGDLGFRETRQGANVWLVVPNDLGVMDNRGKGQGVYCVDPVQAYLDLRFHPERGAEMAPLLRRQIDIARRLRARDFLEDILDDYEREGVSREMIDFAREAIHNSVRYRPELHQWGDRGRTR